MPAGYSKLTGLNPFKGKKRPPFSKEHIEKLRTSHLGQKAWNKGIKWEAMQNEKNPAWKGDKVSYRTLHYWIQHHLGKANQCSNDSTHKSTRYHWANISGEYKRDASDWHELCPRCNKLDGVPKHERFKV